MFKTKKKESAALRVGRAMLEQIMRDRDLDEESAAAVYGEEGLPETDELTAARAAAELIALANMKNLDGEDGKAYVDRLLADERFVELVRSMPLRLALGVYEKYVTGGANGIEGRNARISQREEADPEDGGEDIEALIAKAREEGARDVLEKLRLNAAAVKPLRGESAVPGATDFTNMSSEEFNRIKRSLQMR